MSARLRFSAAALAALFLGGCSTFSKDGGFDSVNAAVKARTGQDVTWVRDGKAEASVAGEVSKLLAEPIGPEQAVRIALLNNRGLQAAYADLGIAEADLVQAGRLVNPGFAYARLVRGDGLEIERFFIFNLMSLITMSSRVEIAELRFEQAKLMAASEALRVALEARRGWFEAVAANEAERYAEQVKLSADASAELAARMAGVGNFSRLQRMREQAFFAETTAQLARARQNAVAARENLTRVLGLWGAQTQFRLPERLPALPTAPQALGQLEATAMRERLDVRAAKHDAESLAVALGLTDATRFVNVLELGYQYTSETSEPVKKGWEVELKLPIFDTGDARLAGAQHRYMQSVQRARQIAVNARSEVRDAWNAYRSSYDSAKHFRDEIVPLRRRISEENLLRYNGMLIGVFELLADARTTIASVNSAIEALRDFWIADSNLQMALTGRSPGGTGMRAAAAPMAGAGEGAGH
jgi:outer membrane protein TolC